MTLQIQQQTKQQLHYWVAGLLGSSGIALSSLVPGGPIETRSFAHINPLTLGLFNTFLTTLALGSLLLIYFVLKSERWAMIAAAVCGLSFLGVYGLDLAQIFPVSPDAMPPALLAIEIIGTLLSLPLILLAIQALPASGKSQMVSASALHTHANSAAQPSHMTALLGLSIVALSIIVFATRSAMGL